MKTLVIKSGVPIPPSNFGKRGSPIQDVLKSMEVNQMFEVDKWKEVSGVKAAAKAVGAQVCSRKLESGKIGVWRTA